mmetsp:Transcript_125962/g.299027  ORF Transcript_125962/g.299027 Transcript_125962/m.299027 type:complete len:201 (-) Transcript_125962:2841-3443(-)
MRVTPESLSTSGPSKSRMTSPASSFRKTLQALMLGPSVIATPFLQLKNFWWPFSAVTCCWLVSVIQPVASSDKALQRARIKASLVSDRGPSRCSSTSSALSNLIGGSPELKSFSKGRSMRQTTKGLGRSFRKAVPWLPLMLTHPSRLSRIARPRIRSMPSFSSRCGPSKTSTTSDAFSDRFGLQLEITKSAVKAMFFWHS